MRINSISSYTPNYQKYNKNNLKTNFKADVRIVKTYFSEHSMPDEHSNTINSIFKSIDGKFKNVGSDNILILLEPHVNGETKRRKIKSDIMLKAMFKDVHRAHKEILDYTKRNQLEDEYRYLKELEKDESKFQIYLSRLSDVFTSDTVLGDEDIYVDKIKDFKMPTQKMVERTINEAIDTMTKYIPDEDNIAHKPEFIYILRDDPNDYESLQFPIV